MICDAGGGTVDLISYEIVNMDPFELKALTKPSGITNISENASFLTLTAPMQVELLGVP